VKNKLRIYDPEVDKSREPLDRLAVSRNLWERRISIVATHYFIRQHDFDDTIRIAETLLEDQEESIPPVKR